MQVAVKLSTYGVALAVMFGGSWALGTLAGPGGGADPAPHGRHSSGQPAADPGGPPSPSADATDPKPVDHQRPGPRHVATADHRQPASTPSGTDHTATPSPRPATEPSTARATGPAHEDPEQRRHDVRKRDHHDAKKAQGKSHRMKKGHHPKRRSHR